MSKSATKKPAIGAKPLGKKSAKHAAFLAELAAYAQEQRTLIQAECEGFATDKAGRSERIARARQDFRYFSKTYFPHYVKGSESAFHTWFYDHVPALIDSPNGNLVNVSAPRGEAKSTLGTQLMTLWCLVTGRKRFVCIVMDSWDQSAAMLEAVKTELTDNPRLRMDFPEASGAGRVWNAGVVMTANGAKVQAFGSGKKMRGLRHGPHRPDFVLLDDIENDEQVRSKEQRDKVEAWVNKTVLNLGPADGSLDVLYLNTILHYDSVANRTHRKPRWVRIKFAAIMRWPDRMDLWEQWEKLYLDGANEGGDVTAAQDFYDAHRTDMNAGAQVSWPTMRPLLRLMQIRAEDHHAFDCEYQNDPTNQDAAFFTGMRFWVQPCRDWVFYGAHDPSLGKNNKGRDPAATLVGGFDRNHGLLDVVEAKVARRLPDLQITHIIDFQREYGCLVWGFEAIQFQEFMRTELVKRSAAAGCPVPAVALHPHSDKDLRIESLSPHVNNGLIRFHPGHTVLNSQVRHWPEADHDDGPDALHMLWMLAVSRAGGVRIPRLGKQRTTKK